MKRIIAAAAALVILCGCARISDEPYYAEDADPPETEMTEDTGEPEEEAPAEEETSAPVRRLEAADFFALFRGSDPVSGRIADNIDEAVAALAPGVSVAELSEESIKEITVDGTLAGQLFRFSVESCDGIITAASDDGDMNAFSFTDSEDTQYIVLLGSTAATALSSADKYISTCTQVDYLGYCAEREGSYVLMPVAAGNEECGIYGVIPNALLMGFDMSASEAFEGIPDSITVRTAGAEKRDEDIFRLFCRIDSRFERDVYYVFTNVFLNGENVTENITENTSFRLEGAGSIDFTDMELSEGDFLYFLGSVYESETDDLICEAPLAVKVENVEFVTVPSAEDEEENGDEE